MTAELGGDAPCWAHLFDNDIAADPADGHDRVRATHRVIATGQTRYDHDLLRVPALHADGERRSIAFTVTLLTDTGGAVAGIAAVVRDETQRWAEQRSLLAELTRCRAAAGEAVDGE